MLWYFVWPDQRVQQCYIYHEEEVGSYTFVNTRVRVEAKQEC